MYIVVLEKTCNLHLDQIIIKKSRLRKIARYKYNNSVTLKVLYRVVQFRKQKVSVRRKKDNTVLHYKLCSKIASLRSYRLSKFLLKNQFYEF